ncbi:hypothetical protein, conserved [Babesia bigemina]|uniref:C3H1-type domain-containing protein n=1 Tax=Babesia bigemina TaxID=5866 RepID=A0A061BQY2_BABBI|nr:hypothetical protein, conserved [Babesia bigemina]CDR71868.1 hypothetical protein, conserved [Babesia bigemina]|eukprot:XP_012770811.1 hypothetical protein, conserved [Babesia bigemina]
MGFLYGVLSEVKNEDAVKTYDNNPQLKLEKVLNDLQSQIGSGRTGLVASVTQVKGWLEGYEREVNEKTGKVIDALVNYMKIIGVQAAQLDSLPDKSFDNVDKYFTAYAAEAKQLVGKLTENGEKIRELDAELKNKLSNPIVMISQAVDSLEKSCQNKDLQDLNQYAEGELIDLEKRVANKVTGRMIEFRNTLQDEFNKQIWDRIKKVKGKLTIVDNDLKNWIKAARELLQRTHDEALNKVHEKLNPDGTESNKVIGQKIDALKKAHGKDAPNSATDPESMEYVLKKVVEPALGEAATLVDTKIGITGKNDSEFTKLDNEAGGIYGAASGIRQTLEATVGRIMSTLGKISEAINYSEFVTTEASSDTGLGPTITQLDAALRGDIVALEKLDDRLEKYGDDKFSQALIKAVTAVRKQIEGLTDLKHSSTNKAAEIHRQSVTNLFQIKNELQDAVTEFLSRIGDLKSTGATKYMQPIRDAYTAMRRINDISKSVGSTNSIVIKMLSTAQSTIKRNTTAIWSNPTASTGPTYEGARGEMKEVHKQLAPFKEKIMDKIGSSKDVVNSLRKQIESARSTLHTAAKSIQTQLKDHIQTKLKIIQRNIQSQVDTIISQLRTLRETLRNNVINEINKLKEQGLGGQDSNWAGSSQTAKGLAHIQTTLSGIIGTSDATHLDTLEGIIKIAGEFYQKINDEADKAFKEIDVSIHKEVEATTTDMRDEAQRLYSNRKQAELESLKTLLETQKAAMQQLIDEDKISGVKGILNKIETWFPHNGPAAIFKTLHSFESVTTDFKYFSDSLCDFIKEQVKTPVKPSVAPNENDNSTKVHYIKKSIDTLLSELSNSNHFDRTFNDNLAALRQLLATFPPSSFSGIFNGVLLDGLRAGLDGLCAQLCYAYVNTYDGRRVRELIKNLKHEAGGNKVDAIYDLTDDGRKAAKVCLTALKTVCHDLIKVRDDFMSRAMHKYKLNKSTELGKFINDCGFVLSDQHQQNGELRNSDDMKGTQIIELLKKDGKLFHKARSHIFAGRITEVNDYLCDYYAVCNLTNSSSRQPCNVYEMLCWLTSLQYNAVYTDMLRDGIGNLLETPERALGSDDEGLVSFDMKATYLNAYPKRVTYGNYEAILEHICAQSYILLTKIRGTGDAATYYAVDCCTNALKLKYPATGEECLDMLLDILRRLFPPLKYLLTQCSIDASNFGWRDCPYGKDVPTVKWPCNEHSKEKPKDQPKCQPNCQPNCQAKCQVNCRSNSPLMSYLYDCLPGHLPHQLSSIGCKYTCSTCATGKTGMPCLTPLGFRGFSGEPKTGKDLCDVLTKFFEHEHLSSLLSLAPKAPSTLPEHLSFTLSLVKHWNNGGRHLIQDAFTKAINDQSIGLYEQPETLINTLCNVYGNTKKHHNMNDDGKEASLPFTSLTASCTTQDHCAPYLRSLCDDTYAYLVSKQAGTYFSWAIYSPWTLWKYVQCLLTDFQNISCKDWGCRGCTRGDQCKRGQHGLSDDKNRKAHCQCRSIVGCRGTSSTFYRYGFTYASSENLIINGTKCSSFFDHLTRVLKSQYMKDLLTECDNFLWTIRSPFSYLVLSLWLLSFLYLLHIMVIRLDVLHIKSHLHSPSSHRIAAQSLLAAARVNKLNRVFYLQP